MGLRKSFVWYALLKIYGTKLLEIFVNSKLFRMIVILLSFSEMQTSVDNNVSETGNNRLIATIASLILFAIVFALLYCCKYLRNKERKTKSKVVYNLVHTNDKKPFDHDNTENYNRLSSHSGAFDLSLKPSILSGGFNGKFQRSQFKIYGELAKGHFGTIHIGELTLTSNSTQVVAIKSVSRQTESDLSNFLNEIKIMGQVMPHMNLVRMFGTCTTDIAIHHQAWIFLEYCKFGDLKHFLCDHEKSILSSITNDQINSRCLIQWCYDIAKGMQYLAKCNIMHGDLAARNILLNQDPLMTGYIVAKVADFGLSKRFYDNLKYEKKNRNIIPWKWMAYEYLTRDYFTLTSDVWSFGVVTWEIFSLGRTPYGHINYNTLLDQLESGYRLPCPKEIETISSWSPKQIYDKLSKVCFVSSPLERANFSQVVEIIENDLSENEKASYKNMQLIYKRSCHQ